MMEHDTLETLSTFADGESVATPRLLDALTEPGAHEALVDFIRLRGALEETERDPRPDFVRQMRARLDPAEQPWWRKVVLPPAPALAAAAALFLTTFLIIQALGPDGRDPKPADAPPEPDRVLYFEEGVDWRAISSR